MKMKLTPLQIEIQELGADENGNLVNRGRLCFLRRKGAEINKKQITDKEEIRKIVKEEFGYQNKIGEIHNQIDGIMFNNPNYYEQSIIERPELLQELVKEFLISIQNNA